MATNWDVVVAGWAITVLGWCLSPIIRSVLPKILSYLGFDASQKLLELQIHIIPELQLTMQSVDLERMLERGKKLKSDVDALDKMAAMLRHAREDAEDIFDDAQHKIVTGGIFYEPVKTCTACFKSSYLSIARIVQRGLARLMQLMRSRFLARWFLLPVKTCIARFNSSCLWIADMVLGGAAWILQWVRSSSLFHFLRRSEASLPLSTPAEPIPVPASTVPSDEQAVPVATIAAPLDEQGVPVTATSGRWLSCLCSYFDIFKNHCTSIFCWLAHAIGVACFYRDWSYGVVGITSYKENAGVIDSLLAAISRRKLKNKIYKIESTISEVKKSPLLGATSKSTPDDIANKNRSKIRTATNRKVFGREALRDSILVKLRETPDGDEPSSTTSPCYSVIGIYGVSGSGKTTFARYIRDYIKEGCKEKLFDTVMCIHVSKTFSVDVIFHEMLKDITEYRHSHISDHEELEEKLKQSLRGKRFCLILDDLWVKTKNDPQLEELISPLNVGLKGSKILVTARTKVAAGALCADEPMEIPDLDKHQYLSMFMHYALGGTTIVDEEFWRVGRVIVEKLHGSPIAAVIVAGRLGANRDIRFWKNTAERDMLNDTMDALWWSYQQLSSDIKRCFEYCNIFPRRFMMKKGDLVHLWIAQGFVKTSCAREDMEHVAEGYIQELVSCSFLQPEKTWKDEEFFRIHDLVHDLASMVAGTDCFSVENEIIHRGERWKGDIPRDIRHLFIQNFDGKLITEETLVLGNLRSLVINVAGRVEKKVIDNICKKLPKLRVLVFSLSGKSIQEQAKFSVPESVSQLKYLRYFSLRTKPSCRVILPSTLNKLQHIQLLDFDQGDISGFTFAELVNLRHIFFGRFVKLCYVGKLSSLQTLPWFEVRNEEGCELKQLRDLNKLRGELYISGLENVKSKQQALQANLAAKRLTGLTLWWGYDDYTRCNPEIEADVLEGLCAPVGLRILVLRNFVGCRYPEWMVGKHSGGPKCLHELHIMRCSQPVPASGLAETFPHLRVLRFVGCSWNALPDKMEHLTSLKELYISYCENIRSLPSLPQSLEMFILLDCNDEFVRSCRTVGHANWQKIEHIPNKSFR